MAERTVHVVGWSDDADDRAPHLRGARVWSPDRPLPGPVTAAQGIVLRLGGDLRGPVGVADVLDAATVVVGGLLVGTSDEGDVVVLGPVAREHRTLDLSLLGVLLEVDGALRGTSCGAAALGHPAAAVARSLADEVIDDGALVFTGPLLPRCPLPAGSHATATFGHLGAVTVRVV